MSASELKRLLIIERKILVLLGEMRDEVDVTTRVTFQIARIGDLERLLMLDKMNGQEHLDDLKRRADFPLPVPHPEQPSQYPLDRTMDTPEQQRGSWPPQP